MTPPLPRDDDTLDDATTVLVEGRTAEEALEKVHRDLGDDARILQAEKVRRGGVGGFFAREMVQLTVVAEEEPAPVEHGLAEPLFADVPAEQRTPALVGAAPPDPITRMTAVADADEMAFGTALRTALATPPTPAGGNPPAAVADPVSLTEDPAPAPLAALRARRRAPPAPRPHVGRTGRRRPAAPACARWRRAQKPSRRPASRPPMRMWSRDRR